MQQVNLGMLGGGTVGSGVFHALRLNGGLMASRIGVEVNVRRVAVKAFDEPRPYAIPHSRMTTDWQSVVNDPQIHVVAELAGGTTIARSMILTALKLGKPVVTANKALIAVHGNEIFALAAQKGVMVCFEAAVAGGIPIIKSLKEGLTANKIQWVAGIINGTTNFILSEMRDKGLSFEHVLKQAQALGYAEADPTFDIEGNDAAHKATIISSLSFGVALQYKDAFVQGITQLQAQDIRYAEQLGYRIKLLGITKRVAHGIELRVHPCLVPSKSLIANVEGAMNAVMVHADAVGTTLFYGKGAGSEPTASAVIADLVDIARFEGLTPEQRVPYLGFHPKEISDLKVLPMSQVVTSYYLRLRVADQTGVLAKVTGLLAEFQISIDAVLQRAASEGESQTDLIILTHDCQESLMTEALAKIQPLPSILAPIVLIRKEELI